MITPFDFIERLRAWFFAKDRDITLQDGRTVVVTGSGVTITIDGNGIAITGGGDITVNGSSVAIAGSISHDTDLTGVSEDDHHARQHALDSASDHTGTLPWNDLSKTGSDLADLATRSHNSLTNVTSDQHHNQSHVLATGTALGPDHTISGAAAGQVLRASSSTAARFDPLDHSDLTGVTANQHHNESHTVASHSDTSATGSELNTLTGGGNTSLHIHDDRYFRENEFSSNTGASSAPLETNSGGTLATENLIADTDMKAGRGIVMGNTALAAGTGKMLISEGGAPSTPSSGYLWLYAKTDSRLYYKNDLGTEYGPL